MSRLRFKSSWMILRNFLFNKNKFFSVSSIKYGNELKQDMGTEKHWEFYVGDYDHEVYVQSL